MRRAAMPRSGVAGHAEARRAVGIERAGHVVSHLRLIGNPECAELHDGTLIGPIDPQIDDGPGRIGPDDQAGRMDWPTLPARNQALFEGAEKTLAKMQLAMDLESRNHGGGHVLVGKQIAGGDTIEPDLRRTE